MCVRRRRRQGPLEWVLLTTLVAHTRQDAQRILTWYRLLWRIEDWHRVLKSGCNVEYLGPAKASAR